MTENEQLTALLQQTLVEMSALRKEVTNINKALNYKAEASDKKSSNKDLEDKIMMEIIMKGKARKHS